MSYKGGARTGQATFHCLGYPTAVPRATTRWPQALPVTASWSKQPGSTPSPTLKIQIVDFQGGVGVQGLEREAHTGFEHVTSYL